MATTPSSTAAAGAVPGERRRRHVLLFPLPYQGHITPMFRLAGALHARGFSITVFHTHFNAPDPAQHPAYRFVPVPDGASGPAPVAVNDVVRRILALNRACEAAFEERLAAVLAEYKCSGGDADVACLVADVHLLSMVQVAKRLGVPALALRTGSAAGFTAFLAYPELCEKGYLPVKDSQLDMPVRELPPHRVRDLVVLEGEEGHALAQEYLAHAVATAKASTGLILNTFHALEHRELARVLRDLPVPVFDVGPLHMFAPASESSLLRQDRGCLDWLDTQPPDSVLYVSFGSLACMTQRDLIDTAWGIADSGVPFIWVVRPDLVDGCVQHHQLPEGFEAATRGRGVVVTWAPQEEVLRHRAVGGFWTHNGWNSTVESVAEGVPMLCRPCFGDQMGNARYVEHVWKVGFVLGGEELRRASVEAAIRRLMTKRDGADMRARAGELKKAAVECTGKDGSSSLAIDKLVAHMMSL